MVTKQPQFLLRKILPLSVDKTKNLQMHLQDLIQIRKPF